ncbi:MAG: L,D-transpeptidase family protein [Pseudomonadota bacterium]
MFLLAAGPVAAGGSWPAWLLAFPESTDSVLIADTGNATLYRYYRNTKGELAAATHYMSIGRRGVGKQRAGDRRTPIGVYFITEQLDTQGLNDKYGITAFPIDYPNTLDRRRGRTGDGIWLHGVTPDGGLRPKRDTDGCIALPNEQLATLVPWLEPQATPVVIVREMLYTTKAEAESRAAALKAALEAWRTAQLTGDLEAYFASYHADFEYRGLKRDDWLNLKLAAASAPAELDIEDLTILAEPDDDGLFVTRFQMASTQPNGPRLRGSKRLYWRVSNEDGRYLIVAEDNG